MPADNSHFRRKVSPSATSADSAKLAARNMAQHSPKILVTGGGTSGHISPALALIETLRVLAPESEFLYLGSHKGLEKSLVEAAQIPFVSISTGKLRRYISPENILDQFRVPVGVTQSLFHIKRFRPDVVLATGGYVTVPPVVAAGLCKVPILIHEQTVQLGLANRINARFATRIALSWSEAMGSLAPRAQSKAWVTGNPVRASIFGGDARRALQYFELSDENLPTIYVTGGSLGARVINRAVEECLPQLLARARVIHQCGEQSAEKENDYERLNRARLALPQEFARALRFIQIHPRRTARCLGVGRGCHRARRSRNRDRDVRAGQTGFVCSARANGRRRTIQKRAHGRRCGRRTRAQTSRLQRPTIIGGGRRTVGSTSNFGRDERGGADFGQARRGGGNRARGFGIGNAPVETPMYRV